MAKYTVTYEMEFEAPTAKNAAEQAWGYIQTCTIDAFDVVDEEGETIRTSVGDDEEQSDEDVICDVCSRMNGMHEAGCKA